MAEYVYADNCRVCGEPIVLARSLAPTATMVIRRHDITCPKCGSVFVITAAMLRGEAGEVAAEVVPLSGGDSGGLDALML